MRKLAKIGADLRKLDTELKNSGGDKEKIRELTALVERMTSELSHLRAVVASNAQPAAASSSDAQVAAAVAQLEGAVRTIKAQQADIEALAARLAAAEAAKEAKTARAKKVLASRRAADAELLETIKEAMARNNASPESSPSPEADARRGLTSPGVHVVRTPRPETQNPSLETRHPTPETLNPKP